MNKGILYIMTTVVTGIIKIGQTASNNFQDRMSYLERNGYRNITGLKREFAIEVSDYINKEKMLHTIFEKSRVSNTEFFALDKDIAVQLLSSFDGSVIYPVNENKEEIFENATENRESKLIPDGEYFFKKQKSSDGGKLVKATADVKNGNWKLLKNSILGITEDKGVSQKARITRENIKLNSNGVLLEDIELGECTPSHAGTVVMNQSINGWTDWHDKDGNQVNIYREKKKDSK